MELTAGLGSVDDYIRYIEAGADECFCGYIPYAWDRKYGTVLSLNRREVRCCSVQLGAFSELEILAAMVRAYQKPVQLTFNSLYYLPQQYPEIADNSKMYGNRFLGLYYRRPGADFISSAAKDRLSDFVKRRGWRNQQRDDRIV